MIDCKSHRLVYVSTAIEKFTEAQLQEILLRSRENNTKLNVTGVLLYNDGNILQVLEGEKATIRGLYGKITQDHRHYGCIILQDTPSETRSFENWSMGFKTVTSIEYLQLEGYWDMRRKNFPLINSDGESEILEILESFVEHNL